MNAECSHHRVTSLMGNFFPQTAVMKKSRSTIIYAHGSVFFSYVDCLLSHTSEREWKLYIRNFRIIIQGRYHAIFECVSNVQKYNHLLSLNRFFSSFTKNVCSYINELK